MSLPNTPMPDLNGFFGEYGGQFIPSVAHSTRIYFALCGRTTTRMRRRVSSGGTPWNSYGGMPWGGTPWNSFDGMPYGGNSPWGYQDYPYGGDYDYPATWGRNEIPPPNTSFSLLDGRWFGNTGEVLEIRGNRFTLRTSGAAIGGIVRIRNNVIALFSPQTNTTTRYTFLRNQSQLLLDDGSGTVLTFRMHPADAVRQ